MGIPKTAAKTKGTATSTRKQYRHSQLPTSLIQIAFLSLELKMGQWHCHPQITNYKDSNAWELTSSTNEHPDGHCLDGRHLPIIFQSLNRIFYCHCLKTSNSRLRKLVFNRRSTFPLFHFSTFPSIFRDPIPNLINTHNEAQPKQSTTQLRTHLSTKMGCKSSKPTPYSEEESRDRSPRPVSHDQFAQRAQQEDQRNRCAIRAQYASRPQQGSTWNLGGGVVLEEDHKVKGSFKLPS